VNDFILVHEFHAFDELVDVESGFELCESFPASHQVTQRLVVANLKHYVHIFFVFEVTNETHYVLMVQRAVDFNLAGQLLSGFAPG
jgi:hypothetical protein